jgi:hypothetical protein
MIEEIIQKPKRKYVRKPKVVVSLSPNGSLRDRGPDVVVPEVVVSLSPNGSLRDRGPDVVVPEVVVPEVVVPEEVVPEVVQEVVSSGMSSHRVVASADSQLANVAESTTKKPRSQKQLDAFNRMREARLKKSAELQELKAFEKEKQLFEKEQLKVEKMEKKIVRKVSRVPKSSPHPAPAPAPQLPILVPQGGPNQPRLVPFKETNVRPILFV